MTPLTRLAGVGLAALALTLSAVTLSGSSTATTGGTAGTSAVAGGTAGHRGVCARQGILFCEDFERLPTGGAASLDWGVDTRAGTLTVERLARRSAPAAGRKGLHVHTVGNGHAFLVADVDPPDNSFYGRMLMRVPVFPTAPDWAHYTLVEASGQGAGVVRPIGGQYAPPVGRALWGVGSDGGPTGDWTSWQESAPSVAGRWQCVEWRQDASDNRVEVWLDGRPQPDLTVTTTEHGGADVDFVFPQFDTVRVGWQLYQPNDGTWDVLLDDVALGTQRLGCA